MLDITKFIKALKCTWVRRIIKSDSAWTSIFSETFGRNSIKHLTDVGEDYLNYLNKNNTNLFWKDVLTSWKEVLSNTIQKTIR